MSSLQTPDDRQIISDSPEEKLQRRIKSAEEALQKKIQYEKEMRLADKAANCRLRHKHALEYLAEHWFRVRPTGESAELIVLDRLVATRARQRCLAYLLGHGALGAVFYMMPHWYTILFAIASLASTTFEFCWDDDEINPRKSLFMSFTLLWNRKTFLRAQQEKIISLGK